MIIYIYDIVIY